MDHGVESRRKWYGPLTFGTAVLGSVALLAACTESPRAGDEDEDGNTLERLRDEGTVEVGIAGEVPYGFTEEGEATGESVEVAKAVFEALDVPRVESVQVEFEQLIPELNSGRYDVVAAGMAILPDRCDRAQFSAVDYVTPTAFLVPEGNPEQVNGFTDVRKQGLDLAVLGGTLEEQVAEDLDIPDDRIHTYDDQAGMLQALQEGQADAGALTDISLHELAEQNPDADMEVTRGFTPNVQGEDRIQAGGFVFRAGDDDLVDAFDSELDRLHSTGEWLDITEPFGFTRDNLPPQDLSTEDLCSDE